MPKNLVLCPRFGVKVDEVDYFCAGCMYLRADRCCYTGSKYDRSKIRRIGELIKDGLG